MKRSLENQLLPPKSWRCPRFHQELISSYFGCVSGPLRSFRIGFTGAANATLSMEGLFGGVMSPYASTMSKCTPYLGLCRPHFIPFICLVGLSTRDVPCS